MLPKTTESPLSARRGQSAGGKQKHFNQRRLLAVLLLVVLAILAVIVFVVQIPTQPDFYLIREGDAASVLVKTSRSNPLLLRWKTLTVSDMWEALSCEVIFESERPIHTQDQWKLMRHIYVQTVGTPHSTIGNPQAGGNGFSQPIVASQTSDGKGRGLYASTFIPKGALIWSNHRTAMFASGTTYRNFLKKLPVDFACDVLQWAYVYTPPTYLTQKDNPARGNNTDNGPRICVDLDEGSYCNNADNSNMGSDAKRAAALLEDEEDRGNGMHLFATRDIAKGEELQCDYGAFADSGGWRQFGL